MGRLHTASRGLWGEQNLPDPEPKSGGETIIVGQEWAYLSPSVRCNGNRLHGKAPTPTTRIRLFTISNTTRVSARGAAVLTPSQRPPVLLAHGPTGRNESLQTRRDRTTRGDAADGSGKSQGRRPQKGA